MEAVITMRRRKRTENRKRERRKRRKEGTAAREGKPGQLGDANSVHDWGKG